VIDEAATAELRKRKKAKVKSKNEKTREGE
jgi:hypothetical protein